MAEATEKLIREDCGNPAYREIGQWIIYDDGQDRWLASAETFEDGIEQFVGSILDGEFDGTELSDRTGALEEAYQAFCDQYCECIYSRIGSPSDIEALADSIGTSEEKEIVDELGCEDAYKEFLLDGMDFETNGYVTDGNQRIIGRIDDDGDFDAVEDFEMLSESEIREELVRQIGEIGDGFDWTPEMLKFAQVETVPVM